MRVSDYDRNLSYTRAIQERLVNLTRIQEEMGTGRSLFTPSEDVRRADQALHSESALATDAQYLRNIEDASRWVNAADSSLQAVVDLIGEIDALALAADNSSQNEEDRQASAVAIDQKLEALMELVNASDGDRRLFGGHATTTAPFTEVRDVSGRIIGVSANADTIAGRIYRRISEGEDVQVNISGAQLFQPAGQEGTDSDLFYVVAALRDTVGNNNTPPPGYEDTRSNEHLREQLELIRTRITDQQTYLGAMGQRLEQTKTRLGDRKVQLTDSLEQATGVDMTDLVSRLATEEGAYNALGALGSRLLRQTLIDYLG